MEKEQGIDKYSSKNSFKFHQVSIPNARLAWQSEEILHINSLRYTEMSLIHHQQKITKPLLNKEDSLLRK